MAQLATTVQIKIKHEPPDYSEFIKQEDIEILTSVKEEFGNDDKDTKHSPMKQELENFHEAYGLFSPKSKREVDAFQPKKEKNETEVDVLENVTTAYRCPMCEKAFTKFIEYKKHKKNHYLEKRRCKICNMQCQSIGKLGEHINKHLGLKPFKCDECEKSFVSKHHVKLHKRCHNTDRVHKCPNCPKAFRNDASLRSHKLVHLEKMKEFVCKVCNKDCIDLPNLRKHMISHGNKTEIKCGYCSKVFFSDRGLECHLRTHKELKFPCEYCGKIYPSMYRIKRHIKRAHIPNQCDICNEMFYDRALFTKHKKTHNDCKPAQCEYCQKKFDKAKNLSEHIRLQHKKDDVVKRCPVCDKKFINAALLKNHVKTHDKCFKCPDCNRVFSSRYNLETHSVTHSGARNHKCNICHKSYSTKTSLKNHVASHSEERSFLCDKCHKTFKTNRRLYVHKLSHATEEKYQCDICLQKFRVKQYLKYHQIKHSTVKPFQCDICYKRFKHKKSFEKHVALGRHKKIQNSKEYDCDFCDENFPTKEMLVEHFAKAHHAENVIDEMEDVDVKTEIEAEKRF